MLANVMRQKREEEAKLLREDNEKFNQPYERDVMIYFQHIYKLGGIETWMKNLALKYNATIVYDIADKERIEYLRSLGIECIKKVGQELKCNILLFTLYGDSSTFKVSKGGRKLFIHGDYKVLNDLESIPEYDEVYAVSKVSADSFEEVTGIKTKVLYNDVVINETTKPLIIGVFSRLSHEKGKWRVKHFIEKLKASNKPFLMLIFTDLPFDESDKRVIFFEPVMNPSGWMSICDYICQLSDTEAGSLTMQEALKMGIPVISTRLPILEEFEINESNAKIIDFDMGNLDIEDLWNIPKVKWQEPISKEWEDIMKKKVFRERNEEPKKEVKIEKEEIKEKTKEEPKKKTTKKVK